MTRLGTLTTGVWLPGAPLFLAALVGAGPCDLAPPTIIKSRDALIQMRRNASTASDPRLLEPRFHSTIKVSIISASYPFPPIPDWRLFISHLLGSGYVQVTFP